MHSTASRLAIVTVAALLAAAPVAAQTYPVKPVRIMVGASAGGGTDIIARMLADKFGEAFKQHALRVTGFVTELNITGALWTSRVTSHIPLAAVAAAITSDGVRDAVRIIDRNLRAAGNPRPRIAVAGLNPHAGDGDSFGREEIDVIAPAHGTANVEGLQQAFELVVRMCAVRA